MQYENALSAAFSFGLSSSVDLPAPSKILLWNLSALAICKYWKEFLWSGLVDKQFDSAICFIMNLCANASCFLESSLHATWGLSSHAASAANASDELCMLGFVLDENTAFNFF